MTASQLVSLFFCGSSLIKVGQRFGTIIVLLSHNHETCSLEVIFTRFIRKVCFSSNLECTVHLEDILRQQFEEFITRGGGISTVAFVPGEKELYSVNYAHNTELSNLISIAKLALLFC